MERATGAEIYGCDSHQSTDITLNIQTTTGGNFTIHLNGKGTVEHLKKIISKKLKVSKDRICLLYRERQLTDGTLEENGLLDGSRVILLPSVETGLLSQKPENSVMQALESLNDSQVNDFLSGKSPLNLTMRLGDHMMLIQLQLSTLNSNGSKSSRTSTPSRSSSSRMKNDMKEFNSSVVKEACNDKPLIKVQENDKKQLHLIEKQDLELLQNAFDLYRSMSEDNCSDNLNYSDDKEESTDLASTSISNSSETSSESDQSPIKSLSDLVSSPLKASTSESKEIARIKSSLLDLLSSSVTDNLTDSVNNEQPSASTIQEDDLSDDSDNYNDQSSFLTESTLDEYPMEKLFNTAVDKNLFDEPNVVAEKEMSNLASTSHGSEGCSTTLPHIQTLAEPLKSRRFHYLMHKTSKFKVPIGQNKQRAFMQSVVNKHKKKMLSSNSYKATTSRTEPYLGSRKLMLKPREEKTDAEAPSTSKHEQAKEESSATEDQTLNAVLPTPVIDARTLLEASKNLTQKLKRLSKEVLTNKIDLKAAEETVRSKIGRGAVIESMKHHGKGIYSGTFSGTLNPALQDRFGRPKRDISTIIHILNDLLCASPPVALISKESKHPGATADTSKSCVCTGAPLASAGPTQHIAAAPQPAHCACVSDQRTTKFSPEYCPSCTQKPDDRGLCKKCDTAKALAMDNSKTKCKLEQLRLVMQQKKQRREERKQKSSPYARGSPPKALAPDQPAPIQEEIETVA